VRRWFARVAVVSALVFSVGAAWYYVQGRAVSQRELTLTEAERFLLAAAREGEPELVEGLVKAGAPVEARDGRGFTPLILATYHGHLSTSRVLLAHGADPCAVDRRGNSALMGAAFKGHSEIVQLLLEHPCAVDQANSLRQTAMMFARLFGREEVAALLRNAGASETRVDDSGRSAKDWAMTQVPARTD